MSRLVNEVNGFLSDAEAKQERLAALLRIVVFLAFLGTVLSIRQHDAHHHPLLATALVYGGLTLIGLLLAWRGIFHPLLPYLYVTLEVGLLIVQTILMASIMGLAPWMLPTTPMATIIFVFLAHAAMRYRPWLAVYTAVLFLSAGSLAIAVVPEFEPGIIAANANEHSFLHHQAIPLTVLGLTTLILFVTGRETRRLLQSAVEERIGRARLARFFAPDIAKQLLLGHDADVATGQTRPIIVLFADIRGFSSIAETMSPHDLTTLLSEFREILATSIRNHGGVVDKFIGDAVMAVFGFPDFSPSSTQNAVSCALDIRDSLTVWSRERQARGIVGAEIGIGIHSGEAFVGVIGRESLLEFTVIGDTVNVAERLERMTRTLDADIAVSLQVANKTGIVSDPDWSLAEGLHLPGRNQTIDVYHLPRQQ